MRHRVKRHQLNRFTSWRRSTLNSIARNLLIHQRIRTTLNKAKAARPVIEKLISLAKSNTLAAKRDAFKILKDHKLVSYLFGEIGPRFSKRQSGFIRILNLGERRGDNAAQVILELTEIKEVKKRLPKKAKVEIQEEEKPVKPAEEKKAEEKKPAAGVAVKEKPPITMKPTKKFLGGLSNIFKKERDSL